MKTKIYLLGTILTVFTVILVLNTNYKTVKAKASPLSIGQDPADAKYPEGAKIYKSKCIICHMANGEGIPGAFPPLKNSDYLFADKVRAVSQTLNGSHKPIIVNGITYVMPMTPQVNTKEDAVAVINYVLNAWGNKGGTVSLEDVKDVKIDPR